MGPAEPVRPVYSVLGSAAPGAGKRATPAKRVALATRVAPLLGISWSVGNKNSSENIRRKLKKAEDGPQTPQEDRLNLAFKVFNNRDKQNKIDKAQRDRAKYQLLAAAIRQPKQPGYGTQGHKRAYSSAPPRACLKCSKESH
ncbi:hypothetical protein AAY473_013214 [Plecturocebus cupreus]